MKKVLVTLCGVVLLVALLTAPALAGPFWLSDLVCDLDQDAVFGEEPDDHLPTRPFASILSPSGDLYISQIFFGPRPDFVKADFECTIECGTIGGGTFSCGKTDGKGTLPAQIIKRAASAASLVGLPLVGVCADPSFTLFLSIGGAACRGGFKAP